jgi:signal transduction histidine kinase
MSTPNEKYTRQRNIGRRKQDYRVRNQVQRQRMLFELGQIITSEINLDELFKLIIEQANKFMNTETSSVFMYDSKNEQLWSLVSTDLKRNEVRFPVSHGVAGWVFQHKTPVIINDPYEDPRFLPDIDKKTGFQTRNILCIPLINRNQKCIGTLQTLNKKEKDFTDQDLELLTSASHYVTIALENAKLYKDLKMLDKAKERVINHLSHELKTPLAIISGVMGRIHKTLGKDNMAGLDKTLDRGWRNVKRLIDLQNKIEDILNQEYVEKKERILDLIESTAGLVGEIKQDCDDRYSEILDTISARLESFFAINEIRKQEILLKEFLHGICDFARSSMGNRELNMVRNFDNSMRLFTDRNILEKVCTGLLKNAIENTPDQGLIEIAVTKKNSEIRIEFRDTGVGITSENQKMIFGGFFHTQDTMLYSSKRPYEFNAGGTGSDLLRIKTFSERLGFSVEFESSRCKFIPRDREMCPGRISACHFISEKSECFSSGGSVFSVIFPVN